MTGKKVRNTAVALGVIGATVAVSLLVTTGMTTGKHSAGAPATSTSLSPPLGRGEYGLSAGVHVLDLVALDATGTGPAQLPAIALTLPSGWSNYEGYAVTHKAMGLAFWDVDKVYARPCRWKSKDMVDPGTTVSGLASALAGQPLRNATTPANAVLAGVRGKYLQLSVPRHIDFGRCHQGYFESWTGRGWASDRWEQGPGQVDRIWILHVGGQRLVVDANYLPSATAKDRAELDRIVHSIRFFGIAANTTAQDSNLSAPIHKRARPSVHNGDWIAYATAPAAHPLRREYHGRKGSDVYIVRAGGQPQLVAGRGSAAIWNICPAFSPNGRMLAFGRKAPGGPSIIVVAVTREGTSGAPIVTLKVPGNRARCPKWSSDSSRLAYLNGGSVVVRGLDGSRRPRAAGDPTVHDFARKLRELVSPTGNLVARLSNSGTVVVSRPDGSRRRVIRTSLYAIAEWSPDGRQLLIMTDGVYMMRAVSVRAPFTTTRIVDYIPVNNPRSWPAYGDVSWQPNPPH